MYKKLKNRRITVCLKEWGEGKCHVNVAYNQGGTALRGKKRGRKKWTRLCGSKFHNMEGSPTEESQSRDCEKAGAR